MWNLHFIGKKTEAQRYIDRAQLSLDVMDVNPGRQVLQLMLFATM